MAKKDPSDVKAELTAAIQEERDRLKLKLDKFLLNAGNGKYIWRRRLDRIFLYLREKAFGVHDRNHDLLAEIDFYHKIELMMDIDYDKLNPDLSQQEKEEFVIGFIGQVFKSYYIQFLLSYLEDKESIPLPHIGQVGLRVKEGFSSLHRRPMKTIVGRLRLTTKVRKEVRALQDGERTDVIMDAIGATEKILQEKVT